MNDTMPTPTADDLVAAIADAFRRHGTDPNAPRVPVHITEDVYVRPLGVLEYAALLRFQWANGPHHPDGPAVIVALSACDASARLTFDGLQDVATIRDNMTPKNLRALAALALSASALTGRA